MTDKMSPLVCPNCEATSFRIVETDESISDRDGRMFVIRGFQRTQCENCEFTFVTPKQQRLHHLKLADARRVKDGLLVSRQIREIRESFSFRQEDASRVFGGGPNAFSKYECGYVTQSEAMDKLLRVSAEFPHVVAFLCGLADLPVPAVMSGTRGKVISIAQVMRRDFALEHGEGTEAVRIRAEGAAGSMREQRRSSEVRVEKSEWMTSDQAAHG